MDTGQRRRHRPRRDAVPGAGAGADQPQGRRNIHTITDRDCDCDACVAYRDFEPVPHRHYLSYYTADPYRYCYLDQHGNRHCNFDELPRRPGLP